MVILGDSFTADFPARRTWTQSKGWQTTRTIRGLVAELENFVSELFVAGVTDFDIDPEPNSPYATLTYTLGHADDGSPEETQIPVVWTLGGNDLEKDLWNHPKLTAVTSRMTGEGLVLFKGDVERGLSQNIAPEQMPFFKANPRFVPDARDAAILTAFYRARLEGVQSFPVSQYVLHRSQTVGPLANIRPNMDNVDKMFTTAKLKEIESLPNTLLFSIPDGYWLKRTPTVEQQTNGKFVISQEYWHADSFSSFLYDLVG